MRKCYVIIVALTLATLGFGASTALADKPPAPPGQGECGHGRTGKPCKEDPQPEKGKDCDLHGNKGGVNEDHCKGTTPPPETTTETTTEEETTSTSPTDPSGAPSEPGSSSLEEQLEKQAKKNGAPAETPSATTAASDTLPYTGLPLLPIALLGGGLTGLGGWLRRRA